MSYIGISLKLEPTWDRYTMVTSSLPVRIFLAPATAATAMITGPLTNSYTVLVAGASALIMLTGLGFALSLSQVRFLYDQAAARGFGSSQMRAMQRSGDLYSMRAEFARQGKVKVGGLTRWVGSWRMQGALALMWKEALLLLRGGAFQLVLFAMISLFISWMPIWVAQQGTDFVKVGRIYLALQAGCAFMIGFGGSQMAFIEMLKRVDLNKPLPFSPATITFWETAARVLPSFAISGPITIGTMLIRPEIWQYAIAGFFIMPALTLVINATTMLVTVLLPDYEDPTQRGFRSLMQMLGVAISIVPGVLLGAGLLFAGVNPMIVTIPVVLVNLGISIVICFLAGGLYANFNPSE